MSRPEHVGPPDQFYDEVQAAKYSANSHIISIQTEMSSRALELLALADDNEPRFLLDIGCGSGISGEVITEAGHFWLGIDISSAMLSIAQNEREVEGDLLLMDMGNGLPFRPGTFDGAISISALQWLCHSNERGQCQKRRLLRLFQSLYACLKRGTRAVFQFYPENVHQSELIMAQAARAGFTGGLVIDYPNSTKAKKIYLVLMTGGQQKLPQGLSDKREQPEQVSIIERCLYKSERKSAKILRHSRAWIEAKKERAKKQGRIVKSSSKYSGRKRRKIF